MTDAAQPDGGEAAAPQDARPTDPWAAPGTPGAPYGPPPGAGQYPHPSAQVGPYPYPSDGRPVVEGTNGLAITSLVTGVTCCLWPAALGFGIAALVQLRRRRQRGIGLAIAGVVLGTLGLIAGTMSAVYGTLNFHVSAPRTAPSAPVLPGPGDSDGSTGLTQTQQDFVDDTAELDMQIRVVSRTETDRGMALQDSQGNSQVLIDTLELLGRRQWPTEVKGQIATLVSSLQADETVWQAAALNTADPVGAFQAAMQTNDPAVALATARKAFSLNENNLPADPGSSTQPSAGATPVAV
ncbi:hypothetical protein P3T37_003009 [Kitasatospora sp. MAA4]|uniref:DUF4190 domain-containing protein n=1 Tax=Kitasatospora sp. MAA4 TaxID=3035093 RepID=UPI0024734CD9|nr:DUF4190 domain-containing protein [Kitasatospora sp. MAA4]MDH6133613.1 hypothetical protein [Kitasatospora sp. MAA4]